MKQNNKAIYDIIFYLILPFAIWKFGKQYMDAYYAMLISAVPGIFYTLYCFKKERQFHVTGFYILSTMIVGISVDLLSGSAEKMLWNDVYYHIALGIVVICTIFIKQPLMLYFAADYAALQGYDRKESQLLFRDPRLFPSFQYFTFFFGLQFIVLSSIKIYMISKFGVDGYGEMKAIMTGIGWCISIGIGAGFLWISKKIKQVTAAEV